MKIQISGLLQQTGSSYNPRPVFTPKNKPVKPQRLPLLPAGIQAHLFPTGPSPPKCDPLAPTGFTVGGGGLCPPCSLFSLSNPPAFHYPGVPRILPCWAFHHIPSLHFCRQPRPHLDIPAAPPPCPIPTWHHSLCPQLAPPTTSPGGGLLAWTRTPGIIIIPSFPTRFHSPRLCPHSEYLNSFLPGPLDNYSQQPFIYHLSSIY